MLHAPTTAFLLGMCVFQARGEANRVFLSNNIDRTDGLHHKNLRRTRTGPTAHAALTVTNHGIPYDHASSSLLSPHAHRAPLHAEARCTCWLFKLSALSLCLSAAVSPPLLYVSSSIVHCQNKKLSLLCCYWNQFIATANCRMPQKHDRKIPIAGAQ